MLSEHTVQTRRCDNCSNIIDEPTFSMGIPLNGQMPKFITKFGKDLCPWCCMNILNRVKIDEQDFDEALSSNKAFDLSMRSIKVDPL